MNYWKRQARRRYTAGYKKRKAASEKARQQGLKALKRAEYQRRAKLGNITKKANKLLKIVRKALKEDYMPDAFVNYEANITQEMKKPRDYKAMQQSIEYLEQSDSYEYYQAGGWEDEGNVIRETLGKDTTLFWRIEKRIQDLGYGSFQSIDMIDNYQKDNGGIPANKKVDDIMMAIVRYDKTGEDEYKKASAEADANGDDFEDFDDFWVG